MRIAVHAKVLSEEKLAGIGIYTYNVLSALAGLATNHEFALYSNEPLIHEVNAPNFATKIVHFPKLWSYLRLPLEFAGGKYDLLFVPKEVVPPQPRPRTVVVCYDLMGLLYPHRVSWDAKVHFWIAVRYALKAADRVIAISHATKKDVIEHCGIPPERIAVTHLGFDRRLFKPCSEPERIAAVKARYGITAPYFINTSSLLWYRKNLVRLIQAFHEARRKGLDQYQLVITGKRGEAYDEIASLIRSLSLERFVILTGYIETAEMPVLLSGACALIFPSLSEGFGLPLVEAMACGCPVVTSNCSAMPEVLEGAGLLVDPQSTGDIAAAMMKVAVDADLRSALREKGLARSKDFSWEKTARETLEVFESLA